MSKTKNLDALIRIEDAIKVLCRKTCHLGVFRPDSYCVEMWDAFKDVERVDAVPVVRCKDCKHRQYDSIFGSYWCGGRLGGIEIEADFFCKDGERKDCDHAEGTIQKERS